MSWMPSPGSVIELTDGRFAIVTNVTPLGNNDLIKIIPSGEIIKINDPHLIYTIWWEPEDESKN